MLESKPKLQQGEKGLKVGMRNWECYRNVDSEKIDNASSDKPCHAMKTK